MPSINPNFYKKIRKNYKDMSNEFEKLKNEYDELMNSEWVDRFELMYSISDFYDAYSSFDIEVKSLLNSQKLIEKQKEYEEINSKVNFMISSVIEMYIEIKRLCNQGGGFLDSQYRRIKTFKIDRFYY